MRHMDRAWCLFMYGFALGMNLDSIARWSAVRIGDHIHNKRRTA